MWKEGARSLPLSLPFMFSWVATYEVWLESGFRLLLWKNEHTIEISGQTSEELTPRKRIKSNRLRFLLLEVQSPQQQEVSPPCGYKIRIRSYTRKQDCHGRLPAFLSLSRKLAGHLFLFLCLNRIWGSLRLSWKRSGI